MFRVMHELLRLWRFQHTRNFVKLGLSRTSVEQVQSTHTDLNQFSSSKACGPQNQPIAKVATWYRRKSASTTRAGVIGQFVSTLHWQPQIFSSVLQNSPVQQVTNMCKKGKHTSKCFTSGAKAPLTHGWLKRQAFCVVCTFRLQG